MDRRERLRRARLYFVTDIRPGLEQLLAAAGLDYLRYAASHAGDRPWFAIGGIDLGNVREVIEAGASRIVVVRAIRDAPDPAAAARFLCAALNEASVGAEGKP